MGWLWSNTSNTSNDGARKPEETSSQQDDLPSKVDFGLTGEQRQRIFGKPENAEPPRDAKADQELEAFLNSLETSESDTVKGAFKQREQPEERTDHDRIRPDGSIDISPYAIYPRTMSCRSAFDQAFYCQSLGGKFNDIYRFGKVQPCSEQWGQFWFCMRTKSLPRQEKERQIREHYADREERKKKEYGSSEDVWEMREKPVERAFWKDHDAD